jgi:hypothetical protein
MNHFSVDFDKAKVGIQDNAIQAFVLSFQQISISAAQSLGHVGLIVAESPGTELYSSETGDRTPCDPKWK